MNRSHFKWQYAGSSQVCKSCPHTEPHFITQTCFGTCSGRFVECRPIPQGILQIH